jgi:hypothetical protein
MVQMQVFLYPSPTDTELSSCMLVVKMTSFKMLLMYKLETNVEIIITKCIMITMKDGSEQN